MHINHNPSNDDAFTGIESAIASVPLVSVLIPVYNCEAYIGTAIESVLDRQGVSLEIIVVDDGSTDQTVQVAQSYATRGPVRVLVNESNRGVSHSSNRAIHEARGESLVPLDAYERFSSHGHFTTVVEMARRAGTALNAEDITEHSTRQIHINVINFLGIRTCCFSFGRNSEDEPCNQTTSQPPAIPRRNHTVRHWAHPTRTARSE